MPATFAAPSIAATTLPNNSTSLDNIFSTKRQRDSVDFAIATQLIAPAIAH